MQTISRYLVHTVLLGIVNALSLGLGAWITPGMNFTAANEAPAWLWVVVAVVVLALVNLILRPIILRLAMPFGWVFTLVIGFLPVFLMRALALFFVDLGGSFGRRGSRSARTSGRARFSCAN